jgi:hypothetical protein
LTCDRRTLDTNTTEVWCSSATVGRVRGLASKPPPPPLLLLPFASGGRPKEIALHLRNRAVVLFFPLIAVFMILLRV